MLDGDDSTKADRSDWVDFGIGHNDARVSATAHRLGRAAPSSSELELLRAVLCPAEQAAAAWIRWRATYDIDQPPGRAYDLLPAVSAAIPDALLGDDASRLTGLRRRTWFANQMCTRALTGALDTLSEIGIEPILIKGGNLITTIYDEPGIRPMADTDIVVGPEQFDTAIVALMAAGWTSHGEWIHATDMVDPRGNGIDVHRWALFPRFSRVVEQGWYQRAASSTIHDTPVRRLALPDELVLTVVHGLMTESPSSARWPIDVAHIVGATCSDAPTSSTFWTDVTTSAQEVGVGPIVAEGLALCREEFRLPVPTDTLSTLRSQQIDLLLRAQWTRRKSGAFPPMRIRRFIDLERAAGRQPSPWRYARERSSALHEHGFGAVLRARLDTARNAVRRARDRISSRRTTPTPHR